MMNNDLYKNLSWLERLLMLLLSPLRRISLFNRLFNHFTLKSRQWSVVFPDEGNILIRLPRTHWLDGFRKKRKKQIDKALTFSGRAGKEVLLRQVIYKLYQSGLINKDQHIIDIGAWLADNTLVWAHFLNAPSAKVIAIDPAQDNINFGHMLATENNKHNIVWHQAVCAEKSGIPLYYRGKLNHARFNMNGEGKLSPLQSATIDELVTSEQWTNIGLLHVDVEGFEEVVLRGSSQIIAASNPVILFEQHITHEDPLKIADWLEGFGYKVFMLNEVIPQCELDCRNFIALPKSVAEQAFNLNISKNTQEKIFWATMGPPLISINQE